MPFHLKHTLVRAALKNGAVFEINYSGALGGVGMEGDGGEGGAGTKRNWWAGAREVVRVTKGKGILVSGGAASEAECRAPGDVANLITILGLAQNVAHDASTKVPQSLILRAQTRKTYRAVFSEPRIVIPDTSSGIPVPVPQSSSVTTVVATDTTSRGTTSADVATIIDVDTTAQPGPVQDGNGPNGKKRPREEAKDGEVTGAKAGSLDEQRDGSATKKKKRTKEGRT